jgi:uncharacterized protein YbjT (DUF2867 family)
MRIAVAGGTGLMGRLVVRELMTTGHDPVVLARSRGVDLTTGLGLAEKLTGCEALIDVSNVITMRKSVSVAFFGAATAQLLRAAARAGVGHQVALSIVGVDTVDYGYYLGKRRQEELIAAGPVPWTVLRTTQFHEFAQQLLGRVPGPLVLVPKMRVQPVAAGEVAAALVDRATGRPGGFVPPMAGPEQLDLADMTRRLLKARSSRRLLVSMRLPGRTGAAMAGGGLLPEDPYVRGHQTYSQYLAGLPVDARSR